MTRRLPHFLAAVTTAAAAAVFAVPAQAATRYVAPQGSGSARSAGSPCGSFGAGYRAARPGDVVEIRNGGYGKQTIPSLGRSAPAIELRAAPGASPVASGIDVDADYVTVRGLRSSSYLDIEGTTSDPVDHVTFINMHTHTHLLLGARDFLWKGGSIGPSFNDKASMIGGTPTSYHATYDGVLWHDATRNSEDVHMECLFAAGVQG